MLITDYPAKILLFGEYTILAGSKALAIPYWKYNGRWSFERKEGEVWRISRDGISSFLTHSSEDHIDLDRLKADVENGLWFDSDIPHGHGLGSSGALIAAIYATYGRSRGDWEADKVSLARLEDYFHGSSSGLDPLVSFLRVPLLIHSFDEVQVLDRDIDLRGFFLVDTGRPRRSGPLIGIFQEKLKDPQFKLGCSQVLTQDVNLAIESLMKLDTASLQHHTWHISKFQWEFFPEMIPTVMRGPWSKGLDSGDYVLKLCGAGGGGQVLGFCPDPEKVVIAPELSGLGITFLADVT